MRHMAVIVALIIAAPAYWADDRQGCVQEEDRDLEIKGCSAVIASGRESEQNLAIAYTNRGFAYYKEDDFDQAVADYTEALKHNPKYSTASASRGLIYAMKGRLRPRHRRFRQGSGARPERCRLTGKPWPLLLQQAQCRPRACGPR